MLEVWIQDIDLMKNSVSSEWVNVMELIRQQVVMVYDPAGSLLTHGAVIEDVLVDEKAGGVSLQWAITV